MMRKIMAYALTVGILMPGFSGTGWSASDPQSAPVSITVNGAFSLALANTAGLAFGSQGAGIYSNQVALTVNNNHGIVWTVSVNAAALSDGAGHSFPASKFRYKITGGAGTRVPDAVEANMPATATTIYTADATEYSVNGLGLGLWVIVEVAPDQTAANYTTTLNVTLTDASV